MSATRRPVVNRTLMLMLLALAACVPSHAQSPLFTQCPHIGLSTGCAYLVVVMDGATNVLADPSQIPFDAGDDTLVGVQNSSSTPIASLPLNGGGMAIFAFNMDGICSGGIVPPPPGTCPFGPTGYEGPGTSFTNISADQTTGTVVFSPPIPPGGHAYFSLDGFLTATSNPLQISCNPNGGPSQLGIAYSTTCTASGGPLVSQSGVPATPVYQWSIGSGSLPSGLSFSSTTGSTVTLSGIPDSVGAYTYSVQVTDNSVPSAQSASQRFAGIVNQLGGVCNNTLSAGSASVGPAAVAGSVFVSSPPGCAQWVASSAVSWVTITGGATGTGNGRVDFSVSANGGLPRSATLAIAGQSFVINQLNGCLFGIAPVKASVAAGGGGGSISVGALSSTCGWTAAADPNSSWLAINGSGTGTGPGTVSYTAAPNMSGTGRTGTILVAGQTFTVIQAGTTCNFSLAQSVRAFPAVGGIGTATVQAPAGCVWQSTSSTVPWVTINAADGSGNGTVSYTVQPNPGTAASRTGTLIVAGQMYAVTQAGTSPLTCIASVASPPQAAIEGRTEVLGDLVLSCAGILGSLIADISLTLNTNVTNAITGVNTADAVLTVNGNNPQNGLVSGYNTIHWPGVVLAPASHGITTVLISKVRADASLLGAAANLQSIPVTGLVTVNAIVPVPVTNALATMANAGPALLFQRLQPPPLPLAFGITALLVQYQEAAPAAFQSGAGIAPATRLRLLLTNVPAGVQVLAPVFANGGAAQLYSADFNGAGGSPASGVSTSPLTVTGGMASGTWVVLAADPGQFDTFTFLLFLQNTAGIDLSQLQLTGSLGPVSDVSVASTTAPVPRYRDFSVPQKLVNLRTTSSTLYPPLAFGAPPLAIFTNQLVNDNPNQVATNVVVRDRVTAGGIIQGCQSSGGANCTVIGNEAVVTYGALQPGQSVN
ncbi:MAG TPA: BACON domain-containing carbohydrate-binding protein, partial [Bryobacteraceae bacterium]|nr:BACON domain-containing carbohydrate-binding protein [Bryobacteraceae bacterium]